VQFIENVQLLLRKASEDIEKPSEALRRRA